MFYTYVLKSNKCDELYIGSTKDLRRRVVEHNKGQVESTKFKKPYILIYYEAYKSELDSRRRESMLKLRGQARRQLLSRLKDSLKN
jgi:putative endonuclease